MAKLTQRWTPPPADKDTLTAEQKKKQQEQEQSLHHLLMEIENSLVAFYETSDQHPGEKFVLLVKRLAFKITQPGENWRRGTWPLIELANLFYHRLQMNQFWERLDEPLANAALRTCQKMLAQKHLLLEPNPTWRVQELETIEQLEKQNLSEVQICRVYGWPEGNGRVAGAEAVKKVAAARRGEVDIPKRTWHPPQFMEVFPSTSHITQVVSKCEHDGETAESLEIEPVIA